MISTQAKKWQNNFQLIEKPNGFFGFRPVGFFTPLEIVRKRISPLPHLPEKSKKIESINFIAVGGFAALFKRLNPDQV